MLSPNRGAANHSSPNSPYSSPGTPTNQGGGPRSTHSTNPPIVETLAIGLCLLRRSCGTCPPSSSSTSTSSQSTTISAVRVDGRGEFEEANPRSHSLLSQEEADAEVATAVSKWNALPIRLSEDTEVILQQGNTLFGGPGFEYGSVNNVSGLAALVAFVQIRIAEFERHATAGDPKKFLFAFNSVPSSHFSQNPKHLFAAKIKDFPRGSLHTVVLVPPSRGTLPHWEVVLDGRILAGTGQYQQAADVRHLLVQLFAETVAGRFFYCFFQESWGQLFLAGEAYERRTTNQVPLMRPKDSSDRGNLQPVDSTTSSEGSGTHEQETQDPSQTSQRSQLSA